MVRQVIFTPLSMLFVNNANNYYWNSRAGEWDIPYNTLKVRRNTEAEYETTYHTAGVMNKVFQMALLRAAPKAGIENYGFYLQGFV